MNKYTLYLPLFFALFALAGCEKEHTGYLFTENARYPIDSLKIIRYEDYNQEVIRLEEQLNSYSGEILDSLNAYRTIEAEEEKIIEELDRLEGIMNKHGEKLNAYLDQFEDESDADPDRVQELTDNCEKAYEAWVTYELEVASSRLSWNASSMKTEGARTRRTSPMEVVGTVCTRLGTG